ncbi:MAG TPA: TetR/AcrR family transcriptional regulator [Longimicrobiales bacterium]|nr:TetR/AcrR family transcriptional regulator [Longimicrobiales bacterium]
MAAERAQATDEKLSHILKTAAAIFAEKGYHQASIREISRGTGVSLSGLYYYVSSKEELLFLIQDHCFGTILDNLERLLEGEEDPRARIRLLIENHLGFFLANMREMKVLSHEADALTGEYRRRVNARKKRYGTLCHDILRTLRPGQAEADLRVATFGLFGMMNWIYTWYRPDRDVPLERLADDMTRIFLHGYLAEASGADPSAGRPRRDDAGPSIWRT